MQKKNLFTVLSAVLVMALVLATLAVPSFAQRKLGDVDGDGFITSADARAALRASVKLDTLTDEQHLAADVDMDTFVTSADARRILRASVKLDKLPDVIVGVAEETTGEPETTEPDATPSDASPTDAPPAPETTTEPETPSVPETTTEPETPSVPETTTEPETPSVPETTTEPEEGFIPPAENNEFDMLRKGNYYFTGSTVDSDGRGDLEIAKTPSSMYLGSKFEINIGSKPINLKIAILSVNNKVYIVNPAKNVYLELNKDLMSMLNMDISEFTDTNTFDFSFFPPLDQAQRTERVSGGYVKYIFESERGAINVTMDGTKLICLENAQNGNVYRIDFNSVTDQVPPEKCDLSKLKNAVFLSVFLGSLL